MAKTKLGRPRGGFTQHRRLEQLQELLTKHPKGLSLYELADHLKVSVRTMRRYLKEVEKSFDFDKERQRSGVQLWRIRSSELPRKVELRRTQVYALLAARRLFEPLRGSALFDEIDMAIGKLMAFAQRPGRGPNAGLADARLEDRFLYLPHAPKNYQQRTEQLDDLFQAVSDLRPLRMLYRRADRRTEERVTIHPYALVMHRDSIYAVGYHVEKDEVRTFVLDRMRDTDASATERFELPADFSIDQYFQGQFGIWRSDEVKRVVVEFDAQAAQFVRTRVVHPSQRLEALPGGGIRLTMQVGNLTQVTSWVLEWGARARVITPPELVESVKQELSLALAAYNKPAVGRRAGDRAPGDRGARATKPRATKPGGAKPGATKPGATKPGGAKPGATKPGATKPGATKPRATKPPERKVQAAARTTRAAPSKARKVPVKKPRR